jgi:hypothetical protein
MHHMSRRFAVMCLPFLLAGGCERIKSASPLSPSLAGPLPGVTIQAPAPVEPSMAAQIAIDQQPILLTVANATTNSVRPLTYIFEVSTDASFLIKVFSQTGVQPGANGRTSMRMPDALGAERTYYWRAMADDGANASQYSATANFRVYTPVVIQPPTLRDPIDGVTLATRRPTLIVGNAQRTGPAGAVQYLFEVATDSAMANRLVSVIVDEAAGQTSYAITQDLASATRYFWRSRALDPGHQSEYTAIQSFVSPTVAVTPTPLPIPGGGGSPGPSVASDAINMSAATILNSPVDLASWPAAAALTTVDIGSTGIYVEFTKKDGPNRWPDVVPPGWDGPLQYTLGMCLNIGGKWYCSAVIEYWHGLDRAGGPPSQFALNWFYDPSRWAPMTGHQPSVGEQIGFFVCAGDCRNNTRGDLSPLKERTNVVLVPMPGNGGAVYRF